MLDYEDDSVNGGFVTTPTTALYRGDLNDPQLANASNCPIVFEMCHTVKYSQEHLVANKRNCINMRLALCIVNNEQLPNDLLNEDPVKLYQRLQTQHEQELSFQDIKLK